MAKMELNRQEEYLNRIDRLKLMDDDFFFWVHLNKGDGFRPLDESIS